MINFKKLEITDLEKINKYLLLDKTRSCEKTAGALMMWRNFYGAEWAIFENTLIVRFNEDGKYAYLVPIGENVEKAIYTLGDVIYTGVCNENINKVATESSQIIPNRDNFDYIYDAESLRTFSGKKLHSKRNFLNRFKASCDYEFLFDSDKDELIRFFTEIDKKQPQDETGVAELDETIDMIQNREVLELHTGAVRVNGKIVSATVGAQIHDTLYIHIEKADKEIAGAYQIIVSEFAKAFPDAIYINREDDLGEEGLRQSKLSYKPLYLLEKSVVIRRG